MTLGVTCFLPQGRANAHRGEVRRKPFCCTLSAMAGDLQPGWGHASVPGLLGLWWREEAAWVGSRRSSP